MTSMDPVPWERFTQDPRNPGAAALRAADRDRDVVLQVLGEAYADGRLDRQEYDDRAASTSNAKTLGELPPLIADLVPQAPSGPPRDLALATPHELDDRAVAAYQASRRNAISGMVIPTVITFVIWFAINFGPNGWSFSFPWPVFVLLGTGINVLRVLLHRQDLIAEEREKLEKKQREALERGRPDNPDTPT